MGWGRTLLLGDIGNRLDIEDTERDITRLRGELSRSKTVDLTQDQMIESLSQENAELKLYLAATVRLLVSKNIISEDELDVMVHSVDREDGSADGKFDGDIV
jgi:hypothetical protein